MANTLQLSDVLARLEYRSSGRGYRARCPAHGGDNPTSLVINEGEDGKVLLYCHADGCGYEDILRALGLWDEHAAPTTDRTTGYTKPPKRVKLTDDEKIIMACAGREAMGLMCGPLPEKPTDPELIPPYGAFLEDLWQVYADTGSHEEVQAAYIAMRPALAEAMPKFMRALDRRLKDKLGQALPSLEAEASVPQGPPFQPYSLAELQKESIPPRHWIIDGVIPEGVHVLAGPSGGGKSFWAFQMCLGVGHGGTVFSKFEVEQGEALYLALEDDKRGTQERAEWLESDGATWPRDVYIEHHAKRLDMGLVDDLRGWLEAHPCARLIVVDVLFNIRTPSRSKEDLYAQDYAVAQALKPLAQHYRVAIILLHHCNKRLKADDPLDAVSGTTGLIAPADVKGVFLRSSGEADWTLYLRGRPIAEQRLAFTFRECVWTYLGESQAVERSATQKAILATLEAFDGPMMPKKISEHSNIRADLVRFTLRRMLHEGTVRQPQTGWYTLPIHSHSQHSQRSHTPQPSHDSQAVSADPPSCESVSGCESDHSQLNPRPEQGKLVAVSAVSEISPAQRNTQHRPPVVSAVSAVSEMFTERDIARIPPAERCVCGTTFQVHQQVCNQCRTPRPRRAVGD
jgi:hypothetical protein